MIRIVDDKTNEVKAEMLAMRRSIDLAIKNIKKRRHVTTLTTDERQKVERLERKKEFFKVSNHLPVRLGSIVIDYKTLTAFLKKVNGFNVTIQQDDKGLTVIYKRYGHPGGELRLLDMTERYEFLKELPTIEIDTLEEVTA
ncbi:hypothetical protein [Exiguobacterium sp. s181]|uniref:hypothetical protein n=1 Tax=Exiguobacterium sp. s181 TaxID=2751288 RepID=UPI001BE6399A|nr:hypothetical protein [Exiguobacterium sp. s181]